MKRAAIIEVRRMQMPVVGIRYRADVFNEDGSRLRRRNGPRPLDLAAVTYIAAESTDSAYRNALAAMLRAVADDIELGDTPPDVFELAVMRRRETEDLPPIELPPGEFRGIHDR
jgi:hypothetical protein